MESKQTMLSRWNNMLEGAQGVFRSFAHRMNYKRGYGGVAPKKAWIYDDW